MSALRDIADTLTEDFAKAVRDAENDDIAKLDVIIDLLTNLKLSKMEQGKAQAQYQAILNNTFEGNVGVEVKSGAKR